jgi:hypothetical protein
MEKERECCLENIPLSYLMEKELKCCFAFLSIVMKTGMLQK